MSEHRLEYLDLCAAWALGPLDAVDQARLDEHVARGCRECEAAMREFSAASVLVAISAPRFTPSAGLRQRVLAAASARGASPRALPESGREEPPPRVIEFQPRPAWVRWLPAAVAAALALASGLLWMRVQKLSGDLSTSRKQRAQLELRLADEQKWGAVLRAPEARVSVLEATTDGDPRQHARATYDPATKRAVIVFENFQKPMARDYQLWVFRDGKPASLGVIAADDEGHATLQLENVGDSFALSAFAVSLEPEGGSPNPDGPTGPVVMLGKLSG